MNAAQLKRLEKLERKAQSTREPLLTIREGETHLECLRRHGYRPQHYNPTRKTFEQGGQTYRVMFAITEFPEECDA